MDDPPVDDPPAARPAGGVAPPGAPPRGPKPLPPAQRDGSPGAARALSARLRTLQGCVWIPMPDGAGLLAVDRATRRLRARLYFEDDDAAVPDDAPPP